MSPGRIMATVRNEGRDCSGATAGAGRRARPLRGSRKGGRSTGAGGRPRTRCKRLPVVRRHDEDRVRAVESELGAEMAKRPGSASALHRPRAFRDDVRDAERVGDMRTDPVRSLVIDVIGEPQARALVPRKRVRVLDQAIGFEPRLCAQALLQGCVAGAVEGPQRARRWGANRARSSPRSRAAPSFDRPKARDHAGS